MSFNLVLVYCLVVVGEAYLGKKWVYDVNGSPTHKKNLFPCYLLIPGVLWIL